jgi:hypothetical protein
VRPVTFWLVLTVVGLVEVVACAVVALRARRAGRRERYRRFSQATVFFAAWTVLTFGRVLLLRGGH